MAGWLEEQLLTPQLRFLVTFHTKLRYTLYKFCKNKPYMKSMIKNNDDSSSGSSSNDL